MIAQHQTGGSAEGPLQMSVPHLPTSCAGGLAVGAMLATHQPIVREKVLDPGEALDGMDLLEHRQG